MDAHTVTISPSRRQLHKEISRLQRANDLLEENYQLRHELDSLKAELERCNFPWVLKVKHVKEIMNISKEKAYELVTEPGFPVLWVGREAQIPRQSFF